MALNNPWEAFGIANRPQVSCDFTGSLAVDVCSDFGLTCATSNIGGALEGIDIKHMDALTVIRLSLLETGAEEGTFYEPIVNAAGEIEFKQIGSTSPNLDVYYTVQTHSYKEECKGVMVTGKKPMPYRHEIEWQNLFEAAGGYKVWSSETMADNCNRANFSQIATITYNDPHLSTAYKDGIDNLYEINEENPYDRILGYAYKITPPENLNDDVTISFESTATVWYEWDIKNSNGNPDLGTLISPPTTASELECWAGRGLAVEGGRILEIPPELRYETVRDVTIDKFLGVNAVYVIGLECDVCKGMPKSDAAASDQNIEGNTDLYVRIKQTTNITYKLDEGTHYIVNYEGEPDNRTVKIVFAKNSRPHDNAKFGTETEFYVLPFCAYFNAEGPGPFTGTILPTGGISGVWVKEVWVELSIDTPSFKVVDPRGLAHEIANDLIVEITPLIMTEEPSPIAKDGRIIDLTDGIVDHDPTTTQNLEDTELERAVTEMDRGPGLTLNFSFLDDENEVAELSRVLFDYMNQGDGTETTYICGPDTEVELGDVGDAGGVINSISYSYSDQGSYTISVNEGPYIVGGLDGITGGPYNKQTESFSAEGVIIQDAGNHIDFKVRLDEFGDVYAINCFPAVLRVGDRVNVSIHNNPVED